MNSRKTKTPLTLDVGGSNKLTAFWGEKYLIDNSQTK